MNESTERPINPTIEIKIPVYSPKGRALGDCWTFVTYLLRKSEKENREILLSDHYTKRKRKKYCGTKTLEIISVLKHNGQLTIVSDEANIWLTWDGMTGQRYYPAKILWKPNNSKKVCYQFDGKSHGGKNLKVGEEEKILGAIKQEGYESVRLGGHLSLIQCVQLASECELFVGVESGMGHLCHSVNTPVYIIRNALPFDLIKKIRCGNHCIIPDNADDFMSRFKQHISDKDYYRKNAMNIYLFDEYLKL
jgi:hypothetical protein